ncbi:TrbI/VirB10 family protein [Litorimonas sp.]|uniref:TrbI/VirB10 family protein n=1 Tax=Litorimonas sp. TaxID=1892381 RepID=UPI003A841247
MSVTGMSEAPPNLSIRARPRAVRRFSRKALLGGSLVLGAVMFGALAMALQSPQHDEKAEELYNVTHKPMAAGLELLPKSYEEMKPKLGPPLPGDLGEAYLAKDQVLPTPAQVAVALETSRPKRRAYSAPAQPSYQPAAPAYNPPTPGPSTQSLFFDVGRKAAGGQVQQYAGAATVDPLSQGLGFPVPEMPGYPAPPSGFDLGNAESDPNGQVDKQAFLERGADDIYNSHGLVSPRSPYQVMAGNIIPASLVTGLNSDLPGQVIGQVTENVYDTVTGQHLLIPQGSRLMGRYDSVIAFGQSRALVVWTRLILPNGDSIQLDNLPGSDSQGFAGLKDKVDRHTWQFIKGAALSSLLSIGSELASDDTDRLTRALQNAGQDTANIAGQRIIDRNLNVQPTLRVRQGWRFNVIVSRDLILKPYGGHP